MEPTDCEEGNTFQHELLQRDDGHEPLHLEQGENWLKLMVFESESSGLNVLMETQDTAMPGIPCPSILSLAHVLEIDAPSENCYVCIDVDGPSLAIKDMRALKKRNQEEREETDLFIQRYVPETGGYRDPELLPRRQLRIFAIGDRLCTKIEDGELGLVLTYNRYQGQSNRLVVEASQAQEPQLRRLESHNSMENTQESTKLGDDDEEERGGAGQTDQNEPAKELDDSNDLDDPDATQVFSCPEDFDEEATVDHNPQHGKRTDEPPIAQEEDGTDVTELDPGNQEDRTQIKTQETVIDTGETQELKETSEWRESRFHKIRESKAGSSLRQTIKTNKEGSSAKSSDVIKSTSDANAPNEAQNHNTPEETRETKRREAKIHQCSRTHGPPGAAVIENLPKELHLDSRHALAESDSLTALSEVDEKPGDEHAVGLQEEDIPPVQHAPKNDEIIDDPEGKTTTPFPRRLASKKSEAAPKSYLSGPIEPINHKQKTRTGSESNLDCKDKLSAFVKRLTRNQYQKEVKKMHDADAAPNTRKRGDVNERDANVFGPITDREKATKTGPKIAPLATLPTKSKRGTGEGSRNSIGTKTPQKKEPLATAQGKRKELQKPPPSSSTLRQSGVMSNTCIPAQKTSSVSDVTQSILNINANAQPGQDGEQSVGRASKLSKAEASFEDATNPSQGILSPLSDRSTQPLQIEHLTRKRRRLRDTSMASQQSSSFFSSQISSKRRRVSARAAPSKKQRQGTSLGAVRIMFTKIDVSSEFKRMVNKIGAELLENIEDATRATHFIAGDKEVSLKRTPKLMIGICRTSNILHADWLRESAKAGSALSSDKYLLLCDEEAEERYSFCMKETLRRGNRLRREGTSLLDRKSVFLCKGVAKNKAPTEKEFKLIVEAAGGEWLASASMLKKADSNSAIIITSDPEILPGSQKKQLAAKDIKAALKRGANYLSTTELFDCILAQKI